MKISRKRIQSNQFVKVTHQPDCDFCDIPAEYDGKTSLGGWANMCLNHFRQIGVGLGSGKGQKLVLIASSESIDAATNTSNIFMMPTPIVLEEGEEDEIICV
jgi:hypothetical protein